MRNKECIAMLLAGGQGSRLGALTKNNAKPAVSFGGKYRIIDFSLSNCVNSGIDTVGVLVQYKPLILNKYLGNGQSWDLDASEGGVHVLPPYATETGGEWYAGTADAIYHNMDFIEVYNPDYVLILSGDHLYRMDYNEMLEAHKAAGADLTVSVMEVPIEEANRFGIMSTDKSGRIIEFAEKPANPKSNLASMGIYIFSWPVLKAALIADHKNEQSDKDFGKNVIPMLLADGKKLQAFKFRGYWKDVGTIESYYEAQMQLLDENPEFDIFDRSSHIYSNSNVYPPHVIGPRSVIRDSLVCNGCVIRGEVSHSIIGLNSCIEDGCVIKDSIILPGVTVRKGTKLTRCIVNENTTVRSNVEAEGRKDAICLISSDSDLAAREK